MTGPAILPPGLDGQLIDLLCEIDGCDPDQSDGTVDTTCTCVRPHWFYVTPADHSDWRAGFLIETTRKLRTLRENHLAQLALQQVPQ